MRLILALLALSLFKNDGFFPYTIPESLPFHPEWEVATQEDVRRLGPILAQPFTYLSKGDQCFVFESEDKHYVLKLPFHSKTLPPSWLRPFPFFAGKYRAHKMHIKQNKLAKDAASYVLAFQHFKEETGLVYLHLNRTTSLQRTVTLRDKEGAQHLLDLDQVEFLIQKKGEQIRPTLARWMESGQVEHAKQGLSSLIALLMSHATRGIEDKENVLESNYGFLEGRPMQIDIGRLKKNDQSLSRLQQVGRVWSLLEPLQHHLEQNYPELAEYLEQEHRVMCAERPI